MTLIELMIALGILAWGMLAVLAMHLHALESGSEGRHTTDAARIARDRMEIFQRLPFDDPLLTPNPAWVLNADIVQVNVQTDLATTVPEQTYTVDWRVQLIGGNPDLKQLDVRVTWLGPNEQIGAPLRRHAITSQRFRN